MIHFSLPFIRINLLLFFLSLPVFALDEYRVVLKKNGKVIEGQYVREDEQFIYLVSGGIQVNFKKSILDLERMKQLNVTKDETETTIDSNPLKEPAPDQPQSPLVKAAEKARNNKAGKGKIFTDSDRSKTVQQEESEKTEKEESVRPKTPEQAGYLEVVENLNKEIERLEQELMDAKIENKDTKAVEKLLEDTIALRDRRQSEYEELPQKQPSPTNNR
ncbi:MAG TPA: hypothetical protein VLH08_07475 [Acidobacteriota bacterium]|nr:hypothetical protein [Acidobacteriota bacterium]